MKETIVRLRDDLDSSSNDVATVTFALEGAAYEIDLSKKNADALKKLLKPYVDAGRRVTARRAPAKKTVAAKLGLNQEEVRAWAHQNGHEVSDRGRIPQVVVDAYLAATKPGSAAAPAKKAAAKSAPAKAPAKKAVAKKAPAKKSAPAKKAAPAAKKAPAKKAPAKKSAAKAPAKKAANASSSAAPAAPTSTVVPAPEAPAAPAPSTETAAAAV